VSVLACPARTRLPRPYPPARPLPACPASTRLPGLYPPARPVPACPAPHGGEPGTN